jgi:hypothetical protein
MGRPNKQTVEYFPHFVKSGKTLFILENNWGNLGYAFWFKMLESICESDGHVLRYSDPNTRDYFLARCGIQHAEAVKIFSKLVELGNIDRELWEAREWVWCPSLIENLKAVYAKRVTPIPIRPEIVSGEKTQFPGRKQNSSPMKEIVSGEKTPQSRVKERIGEQRGASVDILKDNNTDKHKDKSDAAALPAPAETAAAPLPASPSPAPTGAAGAELKLPEADIMAIAALYCNLKKIRFANDAAKATFMRGRDVFYAAKDILIMADGLVARAAECLGDQAEHYENQGKLKWDLGWVKKDFTAWDTDRRNNE